MSNILLDVSVDQGHIDFAALKAAPLPNGDQLVGVVVKATEGATYTDGAFAHNFLTAIERDIPVSAYHFFRGGTDGIVQAQHFLRTVNACGGFRDRVTPMVDAETLTLNAFTSQECSLEDFKANLEKFTGTVEAAVGRRMLFYTGLEFWNERLAGWDGYSGHPLLVAAYNHDPEPTVPTGWTSAAGWQYTDDYSIDGIDGPVDASRLYVPIESLIVHG